MILAIDRSTAVTSVAVPGREARLSSKGGAWVAELLEFLSKCGTGIGNVESFVIGCGPGSFAGTRGALAFAHGVAAAGGAKILGLPSGAAFARENEKVAVVGDARRGLLWVDLWDGFREAQKCRLLEAASFAPPPGYRLVTPDFARIGDKIPAEEGVPSAATLLRVAAASPGLCVAEPLPIYLSPAVR